MPTKDRLPEFKRDPTEALISFIAGAARGAADPRGRAWSRPVLGKIDMPNRVRGPIAPGLALVGDAALATDPLFGVGCGWALPVGRMAGRLASPRRCAARSRWSAAWSATAARHTRELARPRLHDPRLRERPEAAASGERLLFSAAARDPQGGGDLRRVRHAPDRAGARRWRRRCRARSASTRGTRSAGAGATRRARPSARRQPRPDERRRGALAAATARRRPRRGWSQAGPADAPAGGRLRPRQPRLRRRLGAARRGGRRGRHAGASPSTCPTSARRRPARLRAPTRRLRGLRRRGAGGARGRARPPRAPRLRRADRARLGGGQPRRARQRDPDRHRHPARLQVAHAWRGSGARRCSASSSRRPRRARAFPRPRRPQRAARAAAPSSSTGMSTITTGGPSARC